MQALSNFQLFFSYAYQLSSAVNFYYCVMLRKSLFVGSSRVTNETDCLIVFVLITEISRRDHV